MKKNISLIVLTVFLSLYNVTKLYSQRYGFVNAENKIVIQPIYYDAKPFSEDLAAVQYLDNKGRGRWGYINKNGEFVIKPMFYSGSFFKEGFAAVEAYGFGFWGVIDTLGNWVIKPSTLDKMLSPQDGMVLFQKKEKYGFYNTDGKKVVSNIYDYAKQFTNGIAAVQKNGKYGFINKKGEVVLPFEYDDVKNDRWETIAKKGFSCYIVKENGVLEKISSAVYTEKLKVIIQRNMDDAIPTEYDFILTKY
jgi:hypothetical protein